MSRTTAYHEAAHAVACVALGGDLTSVTIEPDYEAGHLGIYRSRLHAIGGRIQGHTSFLIEILAGPIGERMHTGRWSWPHARGDLVEVCRVFFSHEDEHSDGYRERALRDLVTDAAAVVAQHWRSIERVARALLRQRTLTGEQVRKLYREREHEQGREALSWRSLSALEWRIWLAATPDQIRVRTDAERAEQTAEWMRSLGMPEREVSRYLREVRRVPYVRR